MSYLYSFNHKKRLGISYAKIFIESRKPERFLRWFMLNTAFCKGMSFYTRKIRNDGKFKLKERISNRRWVNALNTYTECAYLSLIGSGK